jgi:hypothetical protein
MRLAIHLSAVQVVEESATGRQSPIPLSYSRERSLACSACCTCGSTERRTEQACYPPHFVTASLHICSKPVTISAPFRNCLSTTLALSLSNGRQNDPDLHLRPQPRDTWCAESTGSTITTMQNPRRILLPESASYPAFACTCTLSVSPRAKRWNASSNDSRGTVSLTSGSTSMTPLASQAMVG